MKVFLVFLVLIGFAANVYAIPEFTETEKAYSADLILIEQVLSYQDQGKHRFYEVAVMHLLDGNLQDDSIAVRSINKSGFDPIDPYNIFEESDLVLLYLKDYDEGFWEPANFSKIISQGQLQNTIDNMKSVLDFSSLPPLHQYKTGIPFDKIQCKSDLVLIQKYDRAPACVSLNSYPKLVARGWAAKADFSIDSVREPIISYLKQEPRNISGMFQDFVVYESLNDSIISGALENSDYQINCCAILDSGKIAIAFQDNSNNRVIIGEYDLTKQKITSVETLPIKPGILTGTNPIIEKPTKDITVLKPDSMEFFYYPPQTENPDAYNMFMLIRLPEWLGGASQDASAYRAYSAKAIDDACLVKYWPGEHRQRIENPCKGGFYRVIDGVMSWHYSPMADPLLALPYLELSTDSEGFLNIEPPEWSKDANGVLSYGRQVTIPEIKQGSQFLIDSFAKYYPEYPDIPMNFAGLTLADINPGDNSVEFHYSSFSSKFDYVKILIQKYKGTVTTPDLDDKYTEWWQIGDTVIKVSGTALDLRSEMSDNFREYDVEFTKDGFTLYIEGKDIESIRKSITSSYFPEHDYTDMFLVSQRS